MHENMSSCRFVVRLTLTLDGVWFLFCSGLLLSGSLGFSVSAKIKMGDLIDGALTSFFVTPICVSIRSASSIGSKTIRFREFLLLRSICLPVRNPRAKCAVSHSRQFTFTGCPRHRYVGTSSLDASGIDPIVFSPVIQYLFFS